MLVHRAMLRVMNKTLFMPQLFYIPCTNQPSELTNFAQINTINNYRYAKIHNHDQTNETNQRHPHRTRNVR